MAISATPHGFRGEERNEAVDVFGEQEDDGITVGDGTMSDPVTVSGLYRIIATSDCTVRIGQGLSNASGGEFWPQYHMEARILNHGDVIAVDALT